MNAIERAAKERQFSDWLTAQFGTFMNTEYVASKAAEFFDSPRTYGDVTGTYADTSKHFAEPAERADQWQPIATAPKDGTPVLLRDGSIVGSGQYGRTVPWSVRKLDGFYFDGSSLPSLATHWMPLPLPPQEQARG